MVIDRVEKLDPVHARFHPGFGVERVEPVVAVGPYPVGAVTAIAAAATSVYLIRRGANYTV
ncbi:MAG: hypothetical protein OK455_06235 [Thaumarchaeota archaeon]|nr:hypothetical protein [Nitrososphaerota archaeon]